MADASLKSSADALRMAVAGARLDPRVEAISRSLGLNLSDESLWQRIRGDAERHHQLLIAGGSSPEMFPDPDKGTTGLRQSYIIDALAAYEAISRL